MGPRLLGVLLSSGALNGVPLHRINTAVIQFCTVSTHKGDVN